MKSLEESVVIAMDGSDKELFHFLPYILQDIWEIGACPETIINLIKKHSDNPPLLKVLDLGCGKGAVSVRISRELGCNCYGIDAVPQFITYAQKKANEYGVGQKCLFETGDIREKVKDLNGYDIVILGAIGQVFGDYLKTLLTLMNCISENGYFIVDDGYIEDNSDFYNPLILKKSVLIQQIESAGMQLVENFIMDNNKTKECGDFIFDKLKGRCFELIEKHPEKKQLFIDYIKKQEMENEVLENKVICTTMVIKRNRLI